MNGRSTRTDPAPTAFPTQRRFWINTASLDHVEAAERALCDSSPVGRGGGPGLCQLGIPSR